MDDFMNKEVTPPLGCSVLGGSTCCPFPEDTPLPYPLEGP